MFISKKRHDLDLQAMQSASNRLIEAILNHVSQGVFLLDARDRILQPVSRAMTTLFRRRDFSNLTFERLLAPLVDEQTVIAACATLAKMRLANASGEIASTPGMQEVEVRLPRSDDTVDVAYYAFDFFQLDIPGQLHAWMVRVTDRTLLARQSEELGELRPQLADAHPEIQDLRAQLAMQSDVLRCVMQVGRIHFAAAVQRSGAAMKAINAILKKPAREEEAFRQKLEAISAEVAELRREAESLQLAAMESAARSFEESLQELRVRGSLSGNDFLPLAVRLDDLFSHYTQLRSLTKTATKPQPKPAPAAPAPRMTENGTEILAAPQFIAQQALLAQQTPLAPPTSNEPESPSVPSAAPVGSLEATLCALTAHVADEHDKQVSFTCSGLNKVPSAYQAAVKNIAIQLIRNAVIHGIEPAAEREQLGKKAEGGLSLQFSALPDGSCELRFRDDGRGVDPVQVRRIAVERDLITSEAAARLRDRQAIKLIFKERYSTLASTDHGGTNGAGLSFVRRHVHDVGGKIALASEPGKETRFKVSLPPPDPDALGIQADVA
jgi:signal transduction histidine kinase